MLKNIFGFKSILTGMRARPPGTGLCLGKASNGELVIDNEIRKEKIIKKFFTVIHDIFYI